MQPCRNIYIYKPYGFFPTSPSSPLLAIPVAVAPRSGALSEPSGVEASDHASSAGDTGGWGNGWRDWSDSIESEISSISHLKYL